MIAAREGKAASRTGSGLGRAAEGGVEVGFGGGVEVEGEGGVEGVRRAAAVVRLRAAACGSGEVESGRATTAMEQLGERGK